MDYAKYMKGVSRVNTAKLALWAAMLAIVVVAGIAVLGSRAVLRDHCRFSLSRWGFPQTLADALEEQGPGDGGVAQHLGVPAAILR